MDLCVRGEMRLEWPSFLFCLSHMPLLVEKSRLECERGRCNFIPDIYLFGVGRCPAIRRVSICDVNLTSSRAVPLAASKILESRRGPVCGDYCVLVWSLVRKRRCPPSQENSDNTGSGFLRNGSSFYETTQCYLPFTLYEGRSSSKVF